MSLGKYNHHHLKKKVTPNSCLINNMGYTHTKMGPNIISRALFSAQWATSQYEWAPHSELGLADALFLEDFSLYHINSASLV